MKKLIYATFLTAGIMMAQEKSATQSTSTETKIDSKDNGKDVKTQTTTTNSAADSDGNASKDTTVSTTQNEEASRQSEVDHDYRFDFQRRPLDLPGDWLISRAGPLSLPLYPSHFRVRP